MRFFSATLLTLVLVLVSFVAASPVAARPGKPGSRPPSRPGSRPPSRPGSPPPTRPGSRPPSRPGSRPPSRPGSRPPSRPGSPAPAPQNTLIGYRQVSADQAADYNKAGTVTYTGNRAGMQLGKGVYIGLGRDDWPGNNKDWTCMIWANTAKLDATTKMWIPKTHAGKTLWYKNAEIESYMKAVDRSWSPAKTMRLGAYDGMSGDQLLLPPGLLGKTGPLGITATCNPDKKNSPVLPINYRAWKKLKGSRGQ